MSRDEILTLARDAGFVLCSDPMDESEKAALVRFAELVASRVRIKTAKQIEELQAKAITVDMWRGLALAKHGDGRTLGQIEREKAEEVAAEREACAKVCRDWGMERVENWKHDPEMRDDAMARAHDAECCRARILKRGEAV